MAKIADDSRHLAKFPIRTASVQGGALRAFPRIEVEVMRVLRGGETY